MNKKDLMENVDFFVTIKETPIDSILRIISFHRDDLNNIDLHIEDGHISFYADIVDLPKNEMPMEELKR
jgi:hypothetical protein